MQLDLPSLIIYASQAGPEAGWLFVAVLLLKCPMQAIAALLLTKKGDSKTQLAILRIWNDKPRKRLFGAAARKMRSKKNSVSPKAEEENEN